MTLSKTIGCIFIIAGTTLGAGMLALPLVSAGEGFFEASGLLIGLWMLMSYTALLTLEVNIHFPVGTSFGTMARATLGKGGQWVAFVAMILLFYALTAAYISGGSTLFSSLMDSALHWHISTMVTALVFTLSFGAIIYWKTKAVDYVNRVLFTVKFAVLVLVISLMMTHYQMNLLVTHAHQTRYLWLAIPVMFTAFGFHGSIPSIIKYVGIHPRRLRNIFLIGSLIPLGIYIAWVFATVVVFPRFGHPSFYQLLHNNDSVGQFINDISHWFHSSSLLVGINLFSNIAVTTSFLGVGLGLFDFFCDYFDKRTQHPRLWAALTSFIPPLFFALCYPKGFIFALGFAAIALAVLAVLLPGLMVRSWRRQPKSAPVLYTVSGGLLPIYLCLSVGVVIIVLQVLTIFHWLPQFGMN